MRIALAITDTDAWRGRELVVRSDSLYAIGAITAPARPLTAAPIMLMSIWPCWPMSPLNSGRSAGSRVNRRL